MKTIQKVQHGGIFKATHRNAKGQLVSREDKHNLVTDSGLALLNGAFFGSVEKPSLYLGLYANNYNVTETDTIVPFLTAASEIITYDEASRRPYIAVVNGKQTSNTASKAVFTANANFTARGVFIGTSSVKNGNSGDLFAAALFANAKQMSVGDTLTLEYIFVSSSSQ